MGEETDGYIGGLSLQLTGPSNTPVYHVSVRAVNGAGVTGSSMTSSRVKVVQEDEAGKSTDCFFFLSGVFLFFLP